MPNPNNRLIRRRLAGAWVSTVISISLVLLLVGVAAMLLLNARRVSDYFKETVCDPKASVPMDFRDGVDKATEYAWDANGNMTRDRNKSINNISYNVLNLPREIHFNDGHIIRYAYAADGRKLQTEYVLSNLGFLDPIGGGSIRPLSASPSLGGTEGGFGDWEAPGGLIPIDSVLIPAETTLMTRDYCGNVIYRDGVLERVNNDYGYMDGDGVYHYHIKDYQGNVRAVIDGQGTLEEVNNYYPYGGLMGGGTLGNNASIQPYKYGTKELDRQNGLDWYDSQARHYDPLVPRFTTMDPMAEKYYSISPYAYCAGNPIKYIMIIRNFPSKNLVDCMRILTFAADCKFLER